MKTSFKHPRHTNRINLFNFSADSSFSAPAWRKKHGALKSLNSGFLARSGPLKTEHFGKRHFICPGSCMIKNTNTCLPACVWPAHENCRRYNLYNTCNEEFIALGFQPSRLKNSWHFPSISSLGVGKRVRGENKRNRCSSCFWRLRVTERLRVAANCVRL